MPAHRPSLSAVQRGLRRVALLALAVPLLIGATSSERSLSERLLMAHNVERARIGVAPLTWNAHLAASAQQWADHLASTGQFRHASEQPSDPQGENLWAGTRGYFSLEDQVDAWTREKRYFHQGTFPLVSTTGRVEDVGHYTQMVWRETSELGCATASNGTEEFLVCRYASPGNWRGERPF